MRTRRGARVLAACVATLVAAPLLAAAEAPRPVHGTAGAGDAYWPLDGNGGFDVRSYRVRVRYDFERAHLSGRTTVRLLPDRPLASFSLDFLLPVASVTVAGQPATHRRDSSGHELRITPAEPLPAGVLQDVVVTYRGQPDRHGYAGESNWLASRHEVVAMNQPHMAPWWFPSSDHPSDKALMDVAVTVPRGKEVVSNGRLVARSHGRRTTTWRWRADEPMAPYLAFFAAGDFTIKRGRSGDLPWLVAVSRRLSPPDRRASMRLMRKTPRLVRLLERDLGAYPFSVTGGITTSLDPGFALENQTRPTYPSVGSHFDSLVVHELAHQWFGNHVSVGQWRDIWLNEGLATFMEWRWRERQHGTPADRMLRLTYAAHRSNAPWWRIRIGDPGAANLFHDAVYVRGAMTVQALRNRVGEETFWRIIDTWLAEHGGGDATSGEFEALAERISGEDLDDFFTAWLRHPGRPAATTANGLG